MTSAPPGWVCRSAASGILRPPPDRIARPQRGDPRARAPSSTAARPLGKGNLMRSRAGVLMALSSLALAGSAVRAAEPAGPSPLVERIGDRAFIQVQTPSFAKLPLQQKVLAYHLS